MAMADTSRTEANVTQPPDSSKTKGDGKKSSPSAPRTSQSDTDAGPGDDQEPDSSSGTETDPEATASENLSESENNSDDPYVELEAARLEAKEHYDRMLRTTAEFENYKKRAAREMDDFKKYANEALIRELLSVVDNLQRAIDTSQNDNAGNGLAAVTSIVEGVNLTLCEIIRILDKFHVKPIESLGKPFDPAFHQAIQQMASDEHPENTVINEFQKGYLIHGRLLRPAMVVVSKTATDDSN